jgi:hypothetical protein
MALSASSNSQGFRIRAFPGPAPLTSLQKDSFRKQDELRKIVFSFKYQKITLGEPEKVQ